MACRSCSQLSGKDSESETAIREAYAIRTRIHGNDHPFTAADLNLLGEMLFKEKKFEEAEDCLQRSLTIMEKMEGKGKLSHVRPHYSLGLAHGRRRSAHVCTAQSASGEHAPAHRHEQGVPRSTARPRHLGAAARIDAQRGARRRSARSPSRRPLRARGAQRRAQPESRARGHLACAPCPLRAPERA